jgi:hypothetical protein
MTCPNQSVEPTGGSRCAQIAFVSPCRLPPVAHAHRSAPVTVRIDGKDCQIIPDEN